MKKIAALILALGTTVAAQAAVTTPTTTTTTNTGTSINRTTTTTPTTSSSMTSTTTDSVTSQFPQDTFATPTDKVLNTKIRENTSIGHLWNSYKGVKLNTTNGVVTLEGTVDSIKDQQKLVDAIKKIDGVKTVNSSLNFTSK